MRHPGPMPTLQVFVYGIPLMLLVMILTEEGARLLGVVDFSAVVISALAGIAFWVAWLRVVRWMSTP